MTITPEAADRIAELGFQAPVEQMLEYGRTRLPDVFRFEVNLNEHYDMGGEPGVVIEAHGTGGVDPDDRTDTDLGRWEVETFPPEILEHLLMTYLGGMSDAG